jgi:hypothetical protein
VELFDGMRRESFASVGKNVTAKVRWRGALDQCVEENAKPNMTYPSPYNRSARPQRSKHLWGDMSTNE